MDLNCSKLEKSEWEKEYELLTKTYILSNKGYKKSELHLNTNTLFFFLIIVDKNDLEVSETFFYRILILQITQVKYMNIKLIMWSVMSIMFGVTKKETGFTGKVLIYWFKKAASAV